MRLMTTGTLVLALLAGLRTADAADCSRAASSIERALCGNSALAIKDAELNKLYRTVRDEARPAVRKELTVQERAWLARRDADCADGATACLAAHYDDRIGELRALVATAMSDNDHVDDASPVFLVGTWKVVSTIDQEAKVPVDAAALSKALGLADLPKPGTVVQGAAGRLCQADEPCETFGWWTGRLDELDPGGRTAAALHVPTTTTIATGSNGSPRSSIQLVPRGRDLVAEFDLCAPGPKDCRSAYEVWSPASPDAAMVGLPEPR